MMTVSTMCAFTMISANCAVLPIAATRPMLTALFSASSSRNPIGPIAQLGARQHDAQQ